MHHLEIIEAINSFPIAESLNNHDLHLLVEQGELKVFNKSEYVYRQGEPSDKIFFLLKGVVKIASNLSEGRVAGENIRSSNAVSLTQDVTVLAVKIEVIKELAKKNANFSFDLIEYLGKKLKYTEDRLESLALNDARERIIQFLKINAQSFGQAVGFEVLLKHDFTQQDIANFTGTSRQTVTTVMNDLKKRNQIFFKRKSILIRDIKALC